MRWFSDRQFINTMLKIGIPVMIQNLIQTSLNMVDTVMIGQVGKEAIAAVGLANQVFFVMILLVFGINSGASVFIAQLWGKRDLANIKRTMGVALAFGVAITGLFMLAAILAPTQIMSLLSDGNPEIVRLGSDYLRIVGWSYIFTAVSFSFAVAARSIEQAKMPTIVSAFSLIVNTILNYGLIFGKLGLPELGVRGAAIATLIARLIEFIVILTIIYKTDHVLAARPRELVSFSKAYMIKILDKASPVVANETLWAIGNVLYNVAIARIGAEAIASYQVANSLFRFYEVIFMGMAAACQVMIGNRIGAGEEGLARQYASHFLKLSQTGALLIAVFIALSAGGIISLFGLEPALSRTTTSLMYLYAAFTFSKTFNLMMIVGVLRGGGDTKYALYVEVAAVWLVGVPLAFAGAVWLQAGVIITVALLMLEEVLKTLLTFRRYMSQKWLNNVIHEL
ncbi:MATE family efflux transporter [Acidaminobacter hydrogenoformans]|uniref:Probable multidrug resistance protein NorM n=1 Tax=Acidaminobacter hydrogenoformans DSM 2784 TaxID=1120920 RepID=A0A1G5RW59_9FIRM|nr:MATE family efflux transporter [Acidaminobacter hydrogenoformans]SCZ78286.1 putative efflux protein, MATE family [Acidaminobacter hydrogenoformans DSM 2784]